MSYTIEQQFITKNRPYQSLAPQGIVLHDTDDYGATAQAEHDYFNSTDVQASAHCFVDDQNIIQCIPFNEVAWHAGHTANHKFIGVELCCFHDANKFNAIWDKATWLFAYIFVNVLKIHTVTKNNLMSHAEVSNTYHETDHQDPIDYFKEFGKTVDDFRNAVQTQINNMIKPQEVYDMKTIVTYLGDADLFAAVMVAQKYQCPLMKKADFDASGLKAEKIIPIGGKPNSTRFTTFKDAASLV